ncbi:MULTISPECIES: phage holin family protein [unclassified Gemella]|uniref:phage holin family protein n=1 Tax=unclassified Gemella TaxID=2624949 RepID=UPI00143078A0|nr:MULTISPECIES: phage holin family protein [unclassified Gemella]MBF0709717.1 phage holin family protein [Gemella sp. GL1.1]MBF0747234.1 phage holin family protein [Gemella sp. 19428wG2_WT2a]NYS27061.1 phage holin family protein [Gemella sp. GL1]
MTEYLMKEFFVPVVVLAFLLFGKFLKENPKIDNKYIPIILTFTGGLLGAIFFKDTSYVLTVAGLGGFSNNLHQIFKGFSKDLREDK